MSDKPNTKPIRVAVIGCGVAGLAMGRHLAARTDKFAFTIFEQTAHVGGTWVYTEKTGMDEYGSPIHSSMYKNLRTILPKEIMGYLDYKFSDDGPSYVDRDVVLKYINDYCDHFNVRQHIKFLTKVTSVSPLDNSTDGKWRVQYIDLKAKENNIENFDAVAVCNGHYSDPYYPLIPEFEKYDGEMIHSHDFKDPEIFVNKNVLCIGAGASGLDISFQASSVAKQVALCYPPPHNASVSLESALKIVPSIKGVEANGFYFENGEFFLTDLVIFCTGYHYSFPFLSHECGIAVHQRRVTNLYKQLINIKHPTMSILSIPLMTLPFPLSEIQAMFVIKTLTNPEMLPSEREMNSDTKQAMEQAIREDIPLRHFHKLQKKMWDYLKDLIRIAILDVHISPAVEKLYYIGVDARFSQFATFRDVNYAITETEVFKR